MNQASRPVPAPEPASPLTRLAGPRLLQAINLRNLLSFGPDTPSLPLGNLNVLVGPNGSGKSNLLDAIALLRSAAWDPRPTILKGGGIGEWIWKGAPRGEATLDAVIANPEDPDNPIRHILAFRTEQQAFRVDNERIEHAKPYKGHQKPLCFYRYRVGSPVVLDRATKVRNLRPETVKPYLSILAQLRDAESFPEITYLADSYGRVRLYREWAFGRNTVFREPQRADQRNDRLEEDFSNLGLVLNRLRRQTKVKEALLAGLRDLYEGLTDFDVSIEGGTVQVFFTESDFTIPATRLSDGSVRYLCLLAILCDPEPPPLIGLEEPELGLHPDLLPKVADLLVSAAQRTQLIVTTHSDILVDALTEQPEAVVICEKHRGCTSMRHLTRNEVQPWLEKYRLGQLWTQGQLGGNRW